MLVVLSWNTPVFTPAWVSSRYGTPNSKFINSNTVWTFILFTSVVSILQLWDELQGLSEAQSTPGTWGTFSSTFSLSLNCWQVCGILVENIAVLCTALSVQSLWSGTSPGQAEWMAPSLCPVSIHAASYIPPEDKAHPEFCPPAKIS